MQSTAVRRYLAEIGARGGRASRRILTKEQAQGMVAVRLARQAFKEFRTKCFWSFRGDLTIGPEQVPWVAEQLRKHGNREAWAKAAKLRKLTSCR